MYVYTVVQDQLKTALSLCMYTYRGVSFLEVGLVFANK